MKRGREDGIGPGSIKRPASGARGGPGGGSSSGLTTHDAMSYLKAVKERFQDDKGTYDLFLEIMKEFKAQSINTEGVIERVKSLFAGHRELILGFNTFLPKGFEITMPPEEEPAPEPQRAAVEFDQAINYVNKIKIRFASDERVYKAFLEILNMYRKGTKTIGNVYEEVAILFRTHSDLLQEFTYFLPDSSNPAQHMGQPSRRPLGRQIRSGPRVGGLRDVRGNRRGDRRFGRDDPRDARFDRTGAQDLDDRSRAIARKEDVHADLSFFDLVKQRLGGKQHYQDFLKCLSLYSQEIITKTELNAMVLDLLGRSQDLMEAFRSFLIRCEALEFEPEIRGTGGRMSARDMQRLARAGPHALADKYLTLPVSELDVSEWKRCSPSYVQLPSNYPRLRCGQRSVLGQQVLQDTWVSVTSGSEDFSFKHMRKNQYEEALFRCEDDRFELDMVIERNTSTMRAMGPLVEEIQQLVEGSEARLNWRPPSNAMSPIHLRNIQAIYGERGAELRELLDQNPVVAIPVIMFRLQQKDREWRAVKATMAPVWQRIYESNYHKSLDHRSFYFKQTDKRSLGAKAMLGEMRDLVEKRKAGEATGADVSHLGPPELVYGYNDRAVHDDVFKVIKYSFDETLGAEMATRCTQLWCTFVEPMFGLPARPLHQTEKAPARAANAEGGPTSPGGVKRLMDLDALSGEIDADMDHLDGGVDSEMPSAEAGTTMTPDTTGEVASALGVLTGAAQAVGGLAATPPPETAGEAAAREASGSAPADPAPDSCRPLAYADAVQAVAAVKDEDTQPGRQLWGHDVFYIFFRLHHYLYERLWRARKCALQKEAGLYGPSAEAEEGGNEALPRLEGQGMAAQTHAAFMSLLSNLIDGHQDAGAYEDACRALLGTNSYVLFTLDKLIYKMVKQTQLIAQDELAMKLVDLARYEASRTIPNADAVHKANARVLLSDEPVYRFQTRGATSLAVQLQEFDGSDVQPVLMDPGFGAYLRDYTDSPAEGVAGREPRKVPFLRRLLSSAPSSRGLSNGNVGPGGHSHKPGADADGGLIDALRGSLVVNGLECKLSCSSSKVSYVLDTEDVFCRHRQSGKRAAPRQSDSAAARTARFASWLNQKRSLMHQEGSQQLPPVQTKLVY